MQALRFDNRSCASCPAIRKPGRGGGRCTARCISRVEPTPVAAPRLIAYSREVAALLGIDDADIASPEFAQVFGGNALLDGMEPYAANYGGHQFGNWAGQLGDGRAITLGEVDQRARRALGAAAEGRGPDAVFAHRRRPRGAALVGPRVPVQRGDASPRRADHARAQPGRDRRAGRARHVLRRPSRAPSRARSCAASRRRSSASATSSCRAARGDVRAAAAARRLHDPPRFPGAARRRRRAVERQPYARVVRARSASAPRG